MTDTFRALIESIREDPDDCKDYEDNYRTGWIDACNAVLTALAEGGGVGPTDEELLRVAASSIDPYDSCGISIGEYEAETERAVEAYGSELIAFARAVLTRYGTHPRPIPVATDEELLKVYSRAVAADIDEQHRALQHINGLATAPDRDRAIVTGLRAVLARYTTHPRPIPVAERLPTAADCDEEGRCWWWESYMERWELDDSIHGTYPTRVAWLPAAAIPLPEVTDEA